jgi:maltose alpha-D-glucosyltransferase/alpha-amylase
MDKGYIAVPTDNADSPRIAIPGRDDSEQLKVMMTFFLTMPGVPIIYYGDEIGLRYISDSPDVEGSLERSGCRTPMQWDDSMNAGFSSAPIEKIYIPQDSDPNRPTVAKQDNDPNSLLNYVRTLLKLRASSPALGNEGKWALISDVNKPYPMIYMRTGGNEKYIVGINPSDQKVESEIATLNSKKIIYKFGTTEKYIYKAGKANDNIIMPAISAVILKIE